MKSRFFLFFPIRMVVANRPRPGGAFKADTIWIVSGDRNLKLWALRALGAARPVFVTRQTKAPTKNLPSLLVIGCDFACRLEACSIKMCLHALCPEVPTVIARRVPLAADNIQDPLFITSNFLREYSTYSTEGASEELLRRRLNAYIYRSLHPLGAICQAMQVCEEIIAAGGKIAKISELRQVSRLAPASLAKKFKKVSGVSLKKFINRVRLCHCVWELLWTSKPVKCIALDFGYRPVSFSQQFYAAYGAWPSAVRKKLDSFMRSPCPTDSRRRRKKPISTGKKQYPNRVDAFTL